MNVSFFPLLFSAQHLTRLSLQVIFAVVLGLYIAIHPLMSYTTYTSIEEMMDTCTRNNNFRARMKLPSPRPWVRNDL